MRSDALKVRLADDEEIVGDRSEAVGPHAHLARALLARHIEHALSSPRDLRRHAKREARLADARIANDQDHRARNHAAAQDAIELARAGQKARHVLHGDLADSDGTRPVGKPEAQSVACALRRGGLLDERVPRAAAWALAHPLGRIIAALLTDEDRLFLFSQFTPPFPASPSKSAAGSEAASARAKAAPKPY